MFDKILVLRPILEKISDGSFFQFMFSWFMRFLAGVTILVALWASYTMFSKYNAKLPFKFFIGLVVMEIVILALAFIVINILLVRADDVATIDTYPGYPVTPIMVIFTKAVGEIMAVLYGLVGVGAGLASFLVGGKIMRAIPVPVPWMKSLMGSAGVFSMVQGVMIGFLILMTAYYISENVGALVEIVRNTGGRKSR